MDNLKEIDITDITPTIALTTLYAAARKTLLDADGHELLKICRDIIQKDLKSETKS